MTQSRETVTPQFENKVMWTVSKVK